ncbi:hypothetical protein JCM4914_01210 [Streptomyces platensis subsp. malvinus]
MSHHDCLEGGPHPVAGDTLSYLAVERPARRRHAGATFDGAGSSAQKRDVGV